MADLGQLFVKGFPGYGVYSASKRRCAHFARTSLDELKEGYPDERAEPGADRRTDG